MSRLGNLVLACLPALACAGRSASIPAASPEGQPLVQRSLTVEGTLTEARCYFASRAGQGEDGYCSFVNLREDGPAAVVTETGRLVYLVGESRPLAPYASKRVRVRGVTVLDGSLIKPLEILVQDEHEWRRIVGGVLRSTRHDAR